MRKIIAFTTLCFFSLFLKNEKAICKSNCQLPCKEAIKHSTNKGGTLKQPSYTELNTDSDKGLKQYDGFFFKI